MEVKDAVWRLNNPALERSIREALRSWDGADAEKMERAVTWVKGLRDDLVTLIREIDDPEQIDETLAIQYIELKTRWIALNTKINYRMFRQGEVEQELAFRGTAVSMLLGEVESLLEQKDIEQITHFLAQPIRRAA